MKQIREDMEDIATRHLIEVTVERFFAKDLSNLPDGVFTKHQIYVRGWEDMDFECVDQMYDLYRIKLGS